MKRFVQKYFEEWLEGPTYKPLVVRGARQVGKTWLVRKSAVDKGRELFELNFEKDPSFADYFVDNDPRKILIMLESHFNKEILPHKGLLFLDEIQVAPQLLSKLRWFAEELPELPIVAAGSLLDFTLNEYPFSMPVGRIQYVHVEPLSFEEFLIATGHEKLYVFLNNFKLSDTLVEPIHKQSLDLLREYFFVGGMPGVVQNWIDNRSITKVSIVQQDLLSSFRDDFTKYAKRVPNERLQAILENTPQQLGEKFQYSRVNPEVPANALKKALELLCMARVCHKVQATTAEGLPLAAGIKERIFKVLLLDIGLVSALLNLSLHEKIFTSDMQLANEGGLTEQFVGQTLRTLVPPYIEPHLFCWLREKQNSSAEIDFLTQYENFIIPIEVKSGSTGRLRSLHLFMGLKQLPVGIRLNADRPSLVDVAVKSSLGQDASYTLISLPLYMAGQIKRILQEFLK